MIKILHIFSDDKFFDSASNFFDLFPNVENLYYFFSKKTDYTFKYIKNTKKIFIITNKQTYFNLFSNPDINAIFFHSLSPNQYHFVKHIDDKKIVFWWAWGYDIYLPYHGLKPLIDLNLYKPKTLEYIKQIKKENSPKKNSNCFLIRILKRIKRNIIIEKNKFYRKKMISRINYFTPVISIEYNLMKRHPFFKANSFMIYETPTLHTLQEFSFHQNNGNILIGNSYTSTNNHLDIFEKIRNYNNKNQKFIIPINYGIDYGDVESFIKKAQMPLNTLWLKEFISYQEYQSMYNSISHAVFGHIRQQALGNITLALTSGVKIYLYKESLVYQYLKDNGYIVYTIDNDLNQESLSTPLSKDDALFNYNLLKKCLDTKFDKALSELEHIFKTKLS